MHEVSLAASMWDIVSETAAAHRLTAVHTVKVFVGTDCCVSPEALQFAFAWLRPASLSAPKLLIETGPGRDFFLEYIEGEP